MAAATKPLVSIPRPVAAHASSIQPRGELPSSALRCAARKAHSATVRYRVKLMSRVNSCPRITNSSIPARIAPKAESAVYRRAANSLFPSSSRESAVAQYWSGGFSMYTRPFRCGTIQSPLATISRGISA